MSMNAELCREHLARLMSDETRLLTQLEALLDSEHSFLNSNDIDGLEQAGTDRQTCVGALVRVEEERRTLCRMSGKSTDVHGLEQLIKWCDPHGTLKSHWERCADQATRCRDRNDRNGRIVAARLKRVEGMLDIITGRDKQAKTYGPQGTYAPVNTGRMIRSAI